ncbi:MAG TPA: dihydroorotate dehydrogenase electron transfer subunit [Actinomycetota bacterium]|nr:dihydroorotate dehydrogenase electron transfer subunit [Actinomycetota bacterium]
MNPVVRQAPIVSSTRFGAYRELTIEAAEIAEGARPGQFLNVCVQPGGAHLLRRPFSIARVEGATVSIVFDPIGIGTQWLGARGAGDAVDVVGPLGHGFDVTADPGVDLLVGGGYGTAALSFLAAELDARGGKAHAIVGARSRARLYEDTVLDEACASIAIVTDDGSAGVQGLVTQPMREMINRFSPRVVYACGPMPMLRAVAALASEAGVPSQLAVEEFMACGIGVCWTCVLPVRTNGALKHARSCTEGPVFSGEAIAWA